MRESDASATCHLPSHACRMARSIVTVAFLASQVYGLVFRVQAGLARWRLMLIMAYQGVNEKKAAEPNKLSQSAHAALHHIDTALDILNPIISNQARI